MKRLFSILIVAAGLFYAGKANAQTATPAPKSDSVESGKKVEEPKDTPSKIAIDESGSSKPKKKRNNAKSSSRKDDGGSANRTEAPGSSPSPAPAGEIAIDESGAPKPKPKPRNNSGTAPGSSSDSTIIAPANQVGRPE